MIEGHATMPADYRST